jgi:hypothetical protein
MTFDEAMREAAVAADNAVASTMRKYSRGGIKDEPEVTAYLISRLDEKFEGNIGGLIWNSSVVRNGSGSAAEETRIGADLLIHVSLNTPTQSYSKGVLVQAKRSEPDDFVTQGELNRLNDQCCKILNHTPSAFVFNYARDSMRCGAATRFAGSKDRRLYRQCTWRSYRFFLELFRCPIGDPRITSDLVDKLPVPSVIHLHADGQFSDS